MKTTLEIKYELDAEVEHGFWKAYADANPFDREETGDYGDPPYTGDGDEPEVTPAPLTLTRSNVVVALTAARPQAGQEGESVAPARVAGVAPDDPCHLASLFIALPEHQHADGKRLRVHHGKFAKWDDGAYSILPDAIVRAGVVKNVEAEFMRLHEAGSAIAAANAERGQPETAATRKAATKLKVSRQLIGDVLQCLQARCQLPEGLDAPGWIGDGPQPSGLIAARNGILDLRSFAAGKRELLPATPGYFTYNRVDFNIDLHARRPAAWIRFLETLWPNDPDSVRCLQEWFGYLLTPDTSLQKMLMLIGPPRAGKGTIGRILKALIGEGNVVSPTMASLSERFGLAPLIGRTVALFTDARLSGRADSVAVGEQLLSIAGEDPRTIDRKGIDPVTMRLGTRFVFMSNELPRFGEASGALVSRLVILRLTQTFLGREDIGLFDRLAPELPGILLWSIEGWERLKASGRFTVPESAHDLTDEAEDLASPVKTFLREQCELGDTEEHSARTIDLFDAWQKWCRRRGRENPGVMELFFRDLRSAVPSLQSKRLRKGGTRTPTYLGIRILSPIETGEIT